jgi:N-acyl-D-aspartate/D-glutamate deacylase
MLDILVKNGQIVNGTGKEPFIGDVGIRDGVIVEAGKIDQPAKRVIDADGLIVTPGWVDIHTHYDGQATWDPELDPSFSSGVTTAILGNCGVGFAPVRNTDRQTLIELMEGVEEIPETALHEGMRWNWNTFPEFMNVLEETPRTFDIGVLIPHGALRLYAMGERATQDRCASAPELQSMCGVVREAMQAGAFGMSTSRTRGHRTAKGEMTPDYDVDKHELFSLARTVSAAKGIFESAPAGLSFGGEIDVLEAEMALYEEIIEDTGVSLHFVVLQPDEDPGFWCKQAEWAEKINRSKRGEAFALISGRYLGAYLGFFGSHPFMDCPTFRKIKSEYPRSRWLTELAKPEVRRTLLSEPNKPGSVGEYLSSSWQNVYVVGPEAEPSSDSKLSIVAQRLGRPIIEVAYDFMVQPGDGPQLVMVLRNYGGGNFDGLHDVLRRPGSLLSLSDAGAHVMTICDGMQNTFMLTHWVRDRSRGPRIELAEVVRMMTLDNARAFRMHDRGQIAPGYKADLNVIDLDRLELGRPRYVHDLPAGGTRLMQSVSGYRATIVSGVVTREHDQATGARPGTLVRYRHSIAA